jgi:hypothetical protein
MRTPVLRGAAVGNTGAIVYERVAKFESVLPRFDDAIAIVRSRFESGETPPARGVKMLMLVNRQTGKGLAVRSFES